MLLTKNQFFFLLLLLLLSPFILVNVIWLSRSQKTTGVVQGIGHHTGMNLGPSSYALISFKTATDTVWFQGVDQEYVLGDKVPVRYQRAAPSDAKVDTWLSLWGDTFAYGGVALLFWVICFLSKDLVPNTSMIRIGSKPFIQMLPAAPKRQR